MCLWIFFRDISNVLYCIIYIYIIIYCIQITVNGSNCCEIICWNILKFQRNFWYRLQWYMILNTSLNHWYVTVVFQVFQFIFKYVDDSLNTNRMWNTNRQTYLNIIDVFKVYFPSVISLFLNSYFLNIYLWIYLTKTPFTSFIWIRHLRRILQMDICYKCEN